MKVANSFAFEYKIACMQEDMIRFVPRPTYILAVTSLGTRIRSQWAGLSQFPTYTTDEVCFTNVNVLYGK